MGFTLVSPTTPPPSPPVPPFATGAAEGLSVEAGNVVWGTFGGNPLTPEKLSATRQLEMSNNQMIFEDTTSGGPGQGSFTQFGSDRLLVFSGNNQIGLQAIFGNILLQFNLFDFQNLTPALGLSTGFNDVQLRNSDGFMEILCGVQGTSLQIDLINSRLRLFNPLTPDNGQTLQVNGNMSLLTDVTLAGIDFPVTAPFNSSDIDFGLFLGAVPGDIVLLGIDPASVLPNSCFTAWVNAADTVRVRFNNYSAGAQDPPAGNFKVSIIKMT